ncbi:MAG: UDP-3-O-(3-hydroxymyristoyl)glucosamine N-acyltransferase [Fimbriimonadaceae bacterium]|nr:UDP-3-O-(3-hydroxymyristoyl)glucosamine N-acyltransferase [Fimbriimonadaceae bacterium]
MESGASGWTLSELAELVGGHVDGPPDQRVLRPVPSGSDDPEGIAFAESESHLARVERSGVGAVFAVPDIACSKPCIRVANPRAAFGRLLHLADSPLPIGDGVHPTAVIDPGAEVHPLARIGAYAVIEGGAKVASGARVYPFAYVGEGCSIGVDAVVLPHAVLVRSVSVGARAVIHSGVVLGAEGFGFVWDGEKRVKVPQVGGVVLGDDVEIGANTTIDRATAGHTRVNTGTKIDNLVQIAHNVEIGEHGVIAAQAGISGSVAIGDRVTMAGQCAVSDHVTIASDTTFGGRSGITNDVKEKGVYFGLPARPIKEAMRIMAAVARLPDLVHRIRKLESARESVEDDS